MMAGYADPPYWEPLPTSRIDLLVRSAERVGYMARDAALLCPDCGSPMEAAVHPEYTYPGGGARRYYRCTNRLFCSTSHWAHPDGTPLGVPGDRATKAARVRAHDALDVLAAHFGFS